MGMNVGGSGGEDDVVPMINTTPLVDVMLVLLIIFLITVPVVTHTIKVSLPKENVIANQTKPENVNLSVNKDGDVYWNMKLVPSHAELVEKLKLEAVKVPQPEVQVRGDQGARYEFVGKVYVACQRAGILKVGFLTEPPPKN